MPALAATITHTLDKIKKSNKLRLHIRELIAEYKTLLTQAGINASESNNHIQPLIIGDPKETIEISDQLYQKNILVSAIRPPTVPQGTSRLRISITAAHTTNDINLFVQAITNILNERS